MRKSILLSLLLICTLPGIILSVNRVIDPYYCTTLAVVEESYKTGFISPATYGGITYDPAESGHLGYPALILVISCVTGLSVLNTAFLPLGSVIVPLMVFVFARTILKSNTSAILLALFVSFDPSLLPGHYSVFAYTWERSLLFAVLIGILRLYSGRTRVRNILIITVLFIGMFSVYWTTPILVIVFLICISLSITEMSSDRRLFQGGKTATPYAILALIVIYLAFSKILYYEFLPAVLYEEYGNFEDALRQLLEWIPFGTASDQEAKYLSSTSSDGLMNLLLITRYAIITLPIGVYLFFRVRKHLSCDDTPRNLKEIIMLPILATGIAQTIGYAMRGHLSLRYISLLFPPLTVISMEKMGFKRLKNMPIMILVLVSLLALGYSFAENSRASHDFEVENSSDFMLTHTSRDDFTLMDLSTYGIYLMRGASSESPTLVRFYTSDLYGYVIGDYPNDTIPDAPFRYIVVNLNTIDSPIVATGWMKYEPLRGHLEEVNGNQLLSRFFDDGRIVTFYTP